MDHKEKIVLDHMKQIKSIASKFYTTNLGLEFEDLVNYGVLGLLEAIKKFDYKKGGNFSSFAGFKIRAYIIDEIRKIMPISRGYLNKIKQYNVALDNLQSMLLRTPSHVEVSNYMKVSINELDKIKTQMMLLTKHSIDSIIYRNDKFLVIEDLLVEDEKSTPANLIERNELLEILSNAISNLKEREQLILSLYYQEELTFKEIAYVLDLSESRISVIHSKVIVKLRSDIKKFT